MVRSVAIAAVAVTLVGVTLVAVASGGAAASKQRVAIDGKFILGSETGTFKLISLSGGALKADSGAFTGSGNLSQPVVRKNGQEVTLISGTDTYTGKNGTLIVAQRVEGVAAGRGYSIDTGTWKVVSGTGAYAGYTGGGTFAAAATPSNLALFFREEGYLVKP